MTRSLNQYSTFERERLYKFLFEYKDVRYYFYNRSNRNLFYIRKKTNLKKFNRFQIISTKDFIEISIQMYRELEVLKNVKRNN